MNFHLFFSPKSRVQTCMPAVPQANHFLPEHKQLLLQQEPG